MSSCSNCLKVSDPSLNCVENVEKFVEQNNTQIKDAIGRPLSPTALIVVLEGMRKYVRCESASDELTQRIEELKSSEKTPLSPELEKAWLERFGEIPDEFKYLQSSELSLEIGKKLEAAQEERNKSLQAADVEAPIKFSRSALEECWRRRYGYVPKIEDDDK